MDLEINNLARVGVIRDVEDYLLPPEAWTQALNMRCLDEGIERLGGRTQVFGTPTVAPHFTIPVQNASNIYWVYVSLLKAYVFDGTTHTDITRASGDYTAGATRDWNGTLLGGVPILNNGADVPQFWTSALNPAVDLADLTNWPSGATARVIRAFGPYLVAFDVTLSGTRFPHLVLWSHPADPGSVPSSWDTADATKDAGKVDLPDVLAGIIKDALPLRGRMYIYKEGSTWRMTPITGGFIFDFDTLYETSGILTQRCVALTPDGSKHVVATQDDIIMHDGAGEPISLLDRRMRRHLSNLLDSTNYINSFMFPHPSKNEVWFCFPTSGNTNPNYAFIINAKEGGITETDKINFRNAAVGPIQSPSDTTWASASGAWDSYVGPWSQSSRRKTVLAGTDSTKLWSQDDGAQNDGTAFTGTLQRTGLALVGRKRNGEWIVDFHKRKFINRVRLKMQGGPVSVRVGFQDLPGGAVDWSEAITFNPATESWIDVVGSGQAVALEISAAVYYRLAGYVPNVEIIGEY